MNTNASQVAPFGSWTSPITSAAIVAESVGLDQPAIAGDAIFWIEGRAREQGRSVIVRANTEAPATDLTAAGFNVRTRVHEYGGGAMLISGDTIYFSNYADGRLFRQRGADTPTPLTAEGPMRFADAVLDERRQRLICVREDHSEGVREAVNTLVAIDLADGGQTILQQGCDFYAAPRLSPDGCTLAWLSWDHPNMPWDGTVLWCAEIGPDGTLAPASAIAGGIDDPVFQPTWSPAGELHFISERSGWWNLYRRRGGAAQALCPMAAEFGRPLWVLGISTYGFDGDGRIVCSYAQDGDWHLAILDPESGVLDEIATPFRKISDLKVGTDFVVFIGGAPTLSDAVVRLDLRTRTHHILKRAISLQVDPGYLSVPQAITFPTTGGRDAHAFFYAPANRDFVAPAGAKPPLLVFNHGGPTSAASATLNLSIQFWTSRGFAVVDVNYGGSTGYGRAYRQRLNGNWGVVDVDDALHAARYLVARNAADVRQLAIRGGSAGGYTTLAALTFHDDFKAGASYYGVSDLETLAADSHKFESRYLDSLVGPWPAQQALYVARSPIHFTERLSAPLILFQGMDDKVVPPAQAQVMYDAVRAKGLPVAYIRFEGEAHGFRRAENIRRALEAELYFYGRVFGFVPADVIEPVVIDNLPD
ncbi:dipeptidyl aminopeptidase/acylaminoacyl peptidase [Actimicrobium sp. GrIS 1.19]|uniref:S9 family peptidase n=1 Tax=Actimicrobium sp. GrIS 1.19 TaxID=3071708 RepID=UPI002E019BDF|nr:dipeptidyl aminopeptidase/acylaminoacyl peptidase [Actimicrobium sp. GrIS 1.19]